MTAKPSFKQRSRHLAAALTLLFLHGCASQAPSYDPNALETIGRIVSKKQAWEKTQARADSANAGPAIAAAIGPVGLIVGDVLQKKTSVSVFEYRIISQDGREIIVISDYPFNHVGQCVRVFESSRPSYPRFVSSDECPAQLAP